MRCISLWQPWATLIAIGAKKIETRSWSTSYRGPLAIHAAKTHNQQMIDCMISEPFSTAIHDHGLKCELRPVEGYHVAQIPLGCVVATCELFGCERIGDLYGTIPDYPERSFGDYTPGRYASTRSRSRDDSSFSTCRINF